LIRTHILQILRYV